MMDERFRRTSCYPEGVTRRRDFLRTMSFAAAGLALARSSQGTATPQAATPRRQELPPLPAFPPNGFEEDAIQLNFNENPLGPSPAALSAIRQDGMLGGHRYNFIDPLVERLADGLDFPSEQVLIGCGSTEFLQFTPWTLFRDGGNLVLPSPTYGWCAGVVSKMDCEVREVPVTEDGSMDLDAIAAACDMETRLVYLSNPNNPTGASARLSDLRGLLERLPGDTVLMVDEAYAEFLPDGSATRLIQENAPVLVARTFSKAYGLAGIRLGYLAGRKQELDRLRPGWWGDLGINRAAYVAGLAALSDERHVNNYVQAMDDGADYLRKQLALLGFTSLPHRAPFFMTRWKRPTRALAWKLAERKIYVREGSDWGMPDYFRISVGTRRENEALIDALSQLV